MAKHHSARSAFTLTEAIIVVFIIAVLIGLILPQVEKVRGAAARVQCKSHLAQIAHACYEYHQTHGHFPRGTVVGSAKEPSERVSFLAELLPHLEEDNVYKRLDLKQGWRAEANKQAGETAIRFFNCPAASQAEPWRTNHTNYVGVAGSGNDAASLPLQNPRSGVFGYSRTVKVADIKDGMANTLLFIETQRDTGPWAAGGMTTLRGIDPEEPPVGKDAPFGLHVLDRSYPFQRVVTCALAATADGRGRMIPDTVEPQVLAALATIAGNDPVTIDW